jgi:nitroreductase
MSVSPIKRASADHPILDLLAERFSPYAFDPRPVEQEKLLACLEAARWAASSYNEQPWSLLVAERGDEAEFAKMLSCLLEANQAWAKDAGVLMIAVVCKTFQRNGKPNRVAEHDVGLAAGNLTIQATALGLAVHQMAGIDLDKTRQTYGIPATHDPLTGIALGYAADPDRAANEQFAQRDRAPRARKPLDEFVFRGAWPKS